MARSSKGKKISRQPSPYPTIAFYGIRALQGIAAILVLATMIYFISALRSGNFGVPWAFIILLVASFFTLLSLIATSVLFCCSRLPVLLNLGLNIALIALWVFGFGILAWATSATINVSCSADNWGNPTGSGVCRLYKLVFSAALISLIIAILALILDIVARRRETWKGVYQQAPEPEDHKLEGMNKGHRAASPGPFDVPSEYSSGAYGEQQHSGYADGYGSGRQQSVRGFEDYRSPGGGHKRGESTATIGSDNGAGSHRNAPSFTEFRDALPPSPGLSSPTKTTPATEARRASVSPHGASGSGFQHGRRESLPIASMFAPGGGNDHHLR